MKLAVPLLLVVAISGLTIQPAFSQNTPLDDELSVTNTLLVYPSSVGATTWSGTEHVLSPDLDEDALYQEFSARNSAYVPLQPIVIDEVEVAVPYVEQVDDQTPSGSTQSSDAAEVEMPPFGAGEAERVPNDPEDSDAEESIEEEFEPAPEPEPEPEQEVETESDTPEVSSEPVVLKRATASFFAFLGTVTDLFPFVNVTQEESAAEPTVDEVEGSDEHTHDEVEEVEVQEETIDSVAVPEASAENGFEESLQTVTDEVPGILDGQQADSDPVQDSAEIEDAEVESEIQSVSTPTHSLALHDFSTSELNRGEFITSMQLRLSLAASYETQASATPPVVDVLYKNGTSTQHVGSIVIDGEVSNAINGGYFLFALPQIVSTSELNDTSIEVVYRGDTENLDGLYVDAAWLEIHVEHLDKQKLLDRLTRDLLKRFEAPALYTLLSEETDFTRVEMPRFSLQYNSQRNIVVRFLRDLFGRKLAEVEKIAFLHKDIGNVGVEPEILVTEDGILNIQLEEEDMERLRPGEYAVEITVNEGGNEYTDTFNFQWGLLSINPDQTTYELGDTAYITMGALSPNGNTICDADLSLYLIDPEEVLTKVAVERSGLCNGNNVIDAPDYFATFMPPIVGEYEMYLERTNSDGTIAAHTIDTFYVQEQTSFELSRKGPSRIYPKAAYPMEITIHSDVDWEGTLFETVPASFVISSSSASIADNGETLELSWNVSLSANESQTFTYTFDAPDISPYLYTVGHARLEGVGLEDDESINAEMTEQASSTPESALSEEVNAPDEAEDSQETTEPLPEELPSGDVPPVQQEDEASQPSPVSDEVFEEDLLDDEQTPTSETNAETLPAPDLQEQVVASETSNVIFEEHRQWQIASDATGSLIVFFNSAAAIPAGWTCLSCGSGTFYQRIPMGSSTYNTTGGATTHTHTASGVVNTSNTVNTENNGSGFISIPSHTHLYTPTISTVSNLPAYRQFRVIQSNSAGDPASIPAGAIMMFDDATLPSGWTRLAALDGRYPRGENSIANGGSNTHTHTITGNTTAASNLSTLNSRTGGTQVTGAASTHAHSVSGSTASQSIEPPFIEVVFATAAGATSTPTGALAMWSDEPPAQWLDRSSDPASPFAGRFFKGATIYGTTGGGNEHTPANVLGIVSGAASVTDNARTGSTGNSGAHTHLVDVTGFSTATHLPPYVTVIIGKKFGPIPMYTQLAYRLYANANSNTPTDPWPAGGEDLLENEPITAENVTVQNTDVLRLRMQLNVGNSTSTAESFKLQFATTTAACTLASSWTDVGSATSSVAWRGYDNASPSDGTTLSSALLTGTDVLGSYEEQNPSVVMPNTVGVGQDGEWDFVVQQNNAEADTVYCFRMVESDGTPLFAYTEYPSVTTSRAPNSPTLESPFDNQKTASTTPWFEFSAADVEGDDVSYQIQVDNDHDFSSTVVDSNSEVSNLFNNLNTPSDKDPFTNGATIRFDNATAFSNNTTYYWRVRAKDPGGSNQWGEWSTVWSFTIDTSVTVSTWFQTTDEQFNTNTLDGVVGVSDQAQLSVGSTTGTMWSDPIDFFEGDAGTAWGAFSFNDTETSSDLKYTIQYLLDDVWTDIPDSDLSGNAAGFDTSPVSLLGIDKTAYPEIRIEANFTNSGASPSVQDWTVSWDYLIETPTILAPFANEKVGTTTPVFQFETTDPQDDDLIYQLQWSTSYNFSASTTRSSNIHSGFTNLDNGGDTSPFDSGDTIQFKIQAADALTNGTTYWWRVRARDPLGANTYSFYTDPRSFTVDTTVTVATWFQTTQSQFDNNVLSGALTQSGGAVTVATTSDESLVVYAEGTVTTPRYREWDGATWSAESSALDVGSAINWVVTKAAPNRNEYITGTLGSDSDINIQVFQNGSWGDLNEVTTSAANADMRGFDIAYEQVSGDAMVVYCDGDEDPSYEVWDGDSWVGGGTINFTSGVACGWIRLASDPISDEIILVGRNTTGTQYSAWVWDGNSWGDNVTGGSMAEQFNEGIAVAYEDSGNQAVIVVSNGTAANFAWRAWNGSSWTGSATVALGDDFEWGTIAVDDGTDNMALCYIDEDSDIGVVRWNGSSWLGQTELDTAGNAKSDRAFDCQFEVGGARDGYIMVAYSDTTALRYRSWNGSAWAAEATITTITDASTVQMRRTGDNLLQVMAYDDVNDRYDYSAWNGSSWSARQALETNGAAGASPFKEPFMIAPRNPAIEATVIGAPPIDFNDGSGPYFDQMSWNDSEPGASTLTYQIEYYDGDSWELVPDILIPGNAAGNSTSPLDLSGMLPVSTYNQIRPVANLQCSGGDCPALSDWTITWAEGISVSGTAHAYDKTTPLTSGTVAIAVNGVLQTGKTGTIAAGAWTIPNVNVGAGNVVTVFITGAADAGEAVSVTVADGVGDVTGMELYERHLSIGSDDNATVTNAQLGLYDFTNVEDIFFDVDGGNDLNTCATTGCTDAKLYIKSGNTFRPGSGGNVTTHSFENNGTFLPNGNTIRVSGSWDNNATTTMATSSVIFTATTTDSTGFPWYDSSWLYRAEITVQASEVDSDLTDFPVHVDLSDLDATFFNNVTSDGGDIRVTTDDGTTEIPREIVSINTTTDTGEIYFQAPSLSSSVDTTFYIYYGNALANDYAVGATYGRNAVWDNNYAAVYHMQESPSAGAPQYVDSTGNSSGTATNMEGADQVAGIAGNAAELDGVNESIQTNFSQSILSSTWSIFLDADGTQEACDGAMFSRGTNVSGINVGACGAVNEIGYHWNDLATTYNWAGGPVYPTNQWFMASLVVEPTQATAYVHQTSGVTSGSNVVAHASSNINNLDFGWDSFGVARSFDGTIDEARLSTVARPADWLDAEYRSIAEPSTFYAVSPSIPYASSTGIAIPYTLDDADGTLDFFNVTFGETSGSSEWEIQDALDANGVLTVAYGTLRRLAYPITVASNLSTLANGVWSGTGTTTFDGTGASVWSDATAGLQNIGNVVIDGTSKVITLGSNAKAQSITIGANDTFDLAPSNYDITVLGDWVNNNTFNARSGDVIFTSTQTGNTIAAGGDSFYNINFNGAGGAWSFTESTLTVTQNFLIATGTVTMPTGTTTISGSFNNSGGTFAHNNALVYFTGSGGKTITVNGGAFDNAFYDVRFTGSGSWTFQDAATTSNTFRLTQGSVTFPASTLTVGGDFIKTGGTFAHNNGTVVFLTDGLHSITAGGSSFNDVTIRYPGVGTTWYSPSWDYRIPITVPSSAVSEDLADFPVYVDLATLGSDFFNEVKADGGDIRITTEDGTELPLEIVSIDTGAETGELYFKGNLSSSGDTTFYLYYGNAAASGYAASNIYGSDSVWEDGYEAVYHLTGLSDSSPNSRNLTAVGTPTQTGSGYDFDGNTDFLAMPTNFGIFDGSNDFSLQIDFNADAVAPSTDYTTSPVILSLGGENNAFLTFGDGDPGDSLIFRYQGWTTPVSIPSFSLNTDYSVSLTYDASTGVMNMYRDGVLIDSNTGAITIAGGGYNNLIGGLSTGDANRAFDGTIYDVRLQSRPVSTGWVAAEYDNKNDPAAFYATSSVEALESGRTFADANVTILNDLYIQSGLILFPSGTLSVGGSYDNNGTVSHNDGTVLFNSSDAGETVDLGGSPLYNMTFNHPTGGWTVSSNATTTNNTTLTAGSFTLNSGLRLAVQGEFQNQMQNASTTWTGSTLSLEGNSYSINTKTNSGDSYETLLIGSNTDVRMWNSEAAVYSVDPSGSLYSQDHAGVDGDLYIYGSYPRTSGTEYWSYATDFDGTALGVSSRQVDVRFASGASANFTNSTLNITGNANATTSISNQGSGTYTVSVTAGTTTASYYAFEDLGLNGVSLLSGNEVTSLSNGTFEPAISGGSGLRVASTTIGANPALQIFNVGFSTSSPISAFNVTQTGANPASYWWFRNSYGNLDGEAHDNDTGDPGSIRWDDSSLVFSLSGTVYTDNGVTPLTGGTCNGSTNVVRLVVENGATYDTSCSNVDGSFTFNGLVSVGDPTLTVFLNNASGGERAVAVTKTPTEDITGFDLYANRVITRHEDTAPVTIADMVTYDSSDDPDVLFTATTGTPDALIMPADTELFVWASTTFTPNGVVTLQSGGTGNPFDGSLSIGENAIFTGNGTTTYTIGGSLFVGVGGAFEAASTTVLMTATTSGKTISVASGTTAGFHTLRFTGVGGGWNINGNIEATDDIEVASGTVTGTGNIDLLYGSLYGNGLLSLGGGTTTIQRSNTLGGSTAWTLYNLSLGNGTVVGTTSPASNATTTISGRLTINAAHFFNAGSSSINLAGTGTVFVENGTFLEGSGTVRYSGAGAANILSTGYYNLILDSAAGAPTYTATGLGISVAHDLTIGGTNTTSVTFDTNDTALDVNGDLYIENNGSFAASNSGAFTVAGNWDNNGTFTGNNGTVRFDGTGASVVEAGGSAFSSVVIDQSGSITFSEHATASSAFTIGTTSAFALSSGQTLSVGGVFTNQLGGSVTTWTGSTLYLYGGGNYQINGKEVSDTYGALAIGLNTDIRMWNSEAAVYSVDQTASLYSQDHASVDGDLYIFGNYPGNGGTDHWSYATDFDGTDLSGGGERQVSVYFDDQTPTVEMFTSNDTFVPPAGVTEVDVLVVGGGGGGGTATGFGNAGAGGGGGGGVVYEESFTVTPSTPISVTVGAGGGAGPSGNNPGVNGSNSSFGTLTALGGGGGRGGNGNGLNGGSGGGSRGGSGGSATQPSSGSGGFGNRGGNSGGSPAGAAATGGGGAGEAGEDLAGTAGEKGGDGGDGLPFDLTGTLIYYGGGGGGGAAQTNTPVGLGGSGGGGNGANNGTAPTAGSVNTGGGGGGGNNSRAGAAGGSGIVIVRYDGGASMSLANGALSVEGVPGATTTVQSVGTAPYGIEIGGTASTLWNYYSIEEINSDGLTFTGTPTVQTLSYGSFEISQNGGSAITVEGSVLDANPAKTFTNNSFSTTTGVSAYNVTALGSAVSSWRFTNHYGNIDGEAFDNDPDGDPGYIVWDDSAASITISGNVYSDEGTSVSTVCDSTTNSIHIRVAGLTSYTTSCNGNGSGGGTGFYSVSGIAYSPGDSIIVYIDGETQKGANVTADPVSNIANMHIYENRVIVRHENTSPLSIADMAVWDSSDDADIPFTAIDSSPDTLTLPSDRKLIVWNGKTFAPGGNITLQNGGSQSYGGTIELRASAVFTAAGTESHSIGGSFISQTGATFTPANSTLTFTTSGASRTVGINNGSFNNVAFTGTGSWSVADTVLDVNSYTQSNGALTLPTGTTTVSGSWTVTGGSFVAQGPMVFDGTGAHTVAFGGSNAGPLHFTGNGSFTMTDVNATSTGALIKTAGSLTLPSGALTLAGSFDNRSGAVTHNTNLLRIATSSNAFVRAANSDLYGVQFIGGAAYSFVDANLTLLDDLILSNGSLTLATGTLAIGGSFAAQGGTFDHATGTVLFNSSDTGESINPGANEFYNAVFSGAGGGWTMAASATTTRNFTLSLGASYTQAPGTTLYVGNVFTNAIGGAATTWTGSTLILDSASAYSINTKNSGGDHYENLVVGANTDIRAWNSRATSTLVSASASLYSQDHAAQNGALYIYGDFHVSTTTEYWSYATDFDGTSLTGSERAVSVFIAQNATTTVDTGTLNIVGSAGNSTMITNQGSGTYAFEVEGGTFNGLYYAFRNLNDNGLYLRNTPTITSLSQGDFELAVDGGNLITLEFATLDANASKIISGMRFATTSAITGYNVALIGSTTNAWSFVSHTGNLSGEDFDIDGLSECGSLRWSNSACLLTQQTHYRWRHDDGGLDVPDSEWFDANWDSRQRVRLENLDAATYANAVVKLEVPYDPDMQVDFEDLRFTDQSGTTSIPFFVERYSASSDATVWVQVPALYGEDITTIYMYFNNAGAGSQSSSTATFIAADDFEDGNISEYSGNTSLFAVDSSFAYGGSYGLDATGHESDKADDGIARFDQQVSQGEIIRYLQYIDTGAGSGDEVCTLFGVQSPVTANQNYAVCLEQFGIDRISLVRNAQNTDTSGVVLASTTVSYTTGWYEVEIDWQTNDTIDVALYKDGSLVASVSDSDGTYTSGGTGFTFWFQNGGWDNYTSRPRVDTEPTVYFGAKQTDGGATWAAELDDSYTYSQGDVARLRLAIENTGLQITNQNFDLEFAIKGAAPSCEAVSSASYDPVPVQSSCGSSPLCMQSTTYFGDNDSTTDLLFGTEGTFTLGRAVEDPSFTTSALTINQNYYTELEYALTPTVNATHPSYCLRVTDNGDPVDTYLSVAELQLRFAPVVTNVSLNGGLDISLLPGATTTVYATGTVTDQNGYTDLLNATSTIYRSGAGAACSADNNNCYISSAPLCAFSNCSGNSCTVSCQADIYFHADATDVSPYEGEEWLALIEAEDQSGGIDIAAVASGVELLTLQALDVSSAINYGALEVASSTGSFNPTTTVQNLGNVPIDIELEGTDLTDGGDSFIPTSEQKFSTTTFSYAACGTCGTLSSTTPVSLDVDLGKPTAAMSPVTDVVYWGIQIPFGVASNPHTGTNIFYAVSE